MNLNQWPKSSREQEVLKSIYCHKEISRPELKQELGIKGATLYKIIDQLVAQNIVKITGLTQNHASGRRPEVIQLQCNDNYIFTLALKRNEYHMALISLAHEALIRYSFQIGKNLTPESLVSNAYQTFITMCKETQVSLESVTTVGLALVGPLDVGQEMLLGPTHFAAANWRNVPLVSMFRKTFRKPVVFDTLARACLWGSYIPCLYKHYKNMAYFTIGAGIGSGFLLQENIVENKDSILDGLAHMTLEIGGRKCICGEYGCLEAYSTTLEIPKILEREMAIGHYSSLQGKDNITFDMIAAEADAGDRLCRNVLMESGIILAKAILNLLRLFHLEAIIIGGEIIEKSDFFYQAVCEHIHAKVSNLIIMKQEDENEIMLKGIAVKSVLPFFTDSFQDRC